MEYSMEFSKEKSTIPTIDTFDDLIHELRIVFQTDNIDVDYVQNLMLSYKSNPNEWRKYAHFDKHRYTRNLVDRGNGKYNLMLLCWSEGQESSIHDHADAHCFMKVLSGNLHEIRYEWPKTSDTCDDLNNSSYEMQINGMKMLEETQLKLNSVAYINDSIGLHRVENQSHTYPAVSLHLYIPPYAKCNTFDERTGQRSQVKVTFYSKYGLRTPYKLQNPKHSSEANVNDKTVKTADK